MHSPWAELKAQGTAGKQAVNLEEVRRAMEVLACPDYGMEIMGLPSGQYRICRGNELESMCSAVWDLAENQGIYFVINPVPSELNRPALKAHPINRWWLFLDIDPVKESQDVSASDVEHEAARGMAERISVFLKELGWSAPVMIDSGNGWYLFYRVDMPNDDTAQKVVRDFLHAVGDRFDGPGKIDRSVHNSNRLAKVPGTWALKGPNSPTRPHRMAKLVEVPDGVVYPLWAGHLEKAIEALRKPPAQTPNGGPVILPMPPGPSPFEMKAPRDDGGKEAYGRKALQDECAKVSSAGENGRNNQLNESAFSLGQLVGGVVLERIQVEVALRGAAVACGLDTDDNCGQAGIDRTIRSGMEAGMKKPRSVPENGHGASATATTNGSIPKAESKKAKPAPQAPEIFTLPQVLVMDIPEPRWAVPGILSEGLSILAGKPKLGKSWMALNLAMTIAAGGKALGDVQTVPGNVLYLSLEDKLRRVQCRSRKILGEVGMEATVNMSVAVRWPRQDNGGLGFIAEWVAAAARPVLVIIDVWQKYRPEQTRGGGYSQDYDHASELKEYMDQWGVSVLVLHHTKKALQEDVVEEISGTNGFSGAADGVLVLSRSRGQNEGKLFVTGRDVDEKSLALQFDPVHCCWKSLGDAKVHQGSKLREAIIEEFKKLGPSVALWPSEMADRLEKDRGVVKMTMWRMEREGMLKRTGEKYSYPVDEINLGNEEAAF